MIYFIATLWVLSGVLAYVFEAAARKFKYPSVYLHSTYLRLFDPCTLIISVVTGPISLLGCILIHFHDNVQHAIWCKHFWNVKRHVCHRNGWWFICDNSYTFWDFAALLKLVNTSREYTSLPTYTRSSLEKMYKNNTRSVIIENVITHEMVVLNKPDDRYRDGLINHEMTKWFADNNVTLDANMDFKDHNHRKHFESVYN